MAPSKTYLNRLAKQGWSTRQISEHLDVPKSTIWEWLRNHGIKTIFSKDSDIKWGECEEHGKTIFKRDKSGRGNIFWRCRACYLGKKIDRVKNRKIELVEAKGGCCQRCGYNESLAALQFHHRNRAEKEHEISKLISSGKMEEAWTEVEKCDLLCANCHFEAEEEEGFIAY